MCRDIVTQSQNLDKIILRNVVVAQATWWGWCTSAVFDARGASNQFFIYFLSRVAKVMSCVRADAISAENL